jgi:hypothetical protein
MTPEQRKRLLAALIKDRDQTRAALDYINQQKQHEETLYWETGVMRETTRNDDSQLRQHADGLFMQHEQTVKAFYDALEKPYN